MNESVLNKELETIIEISSEFGIDKIVLFGSCLDNIASARDIDIAVSGINPRDFFKYYGKVSTAVDDEVDIVDLNDLREHIQKRILSKGKVIYEKSVH